MANTSRRLGLEKMDEPIDPMDFSESIEDYHRQGDQILSIIYEIQSSQTLSGQNNEELQKYINLLIEEVNRMKGNDIHLAKNAKLNLIKTIAKFSLYFE
ncbi:hypothetical protein [Leptospira kanakyensis]|uniref:hypothetical protein n=1 Tax=Leptospira kanakyensis TaxID=2484968 RepID=UPI00223D0500|nr:hypothetical protein [Leptospira kanakyensis]MCW7469538.1 hypothetical protein [Leptospira kanakyensis]